jgi:hypothetical protein
MMSMVKSATTPSSSTIRVRSLAVDEEKMFHKEQLILRGKIHRNAKISSTFLFMMQLATTRSEFVESKSRFNRSPWQEEQGNYQNPLIRCKLLCSI